MKLDLQYAIGGKPGHKRLEGVNAWNITEQGTLVIDFLDGASIVIAPGVWCWIERIVE